MTATLQYYLYIDGLEWEDDPKFKNQNVLGVSIKNFGKHTLSQIKIEGIYESGTTGQTKSFFQTTVNELSPNQNTAVLEKYIVDNKKLAHYDSGLMTAYFKVKWQTVEYFFNLAIYDTSKQYTKVDSYIYKNNTYIRKEDLIKAINKDRKQD